MYPPAPSVDALLSVVTGITLSGGLGLCVVVAVFPFDVERVISGILLSLGYGFLPCMAALFATHSRRSQSYPSSTKGLKALCCFMSRLVHLSSPGLVSSVNNNTCTYVVEMPYDAIGSAINVTCHNSECAVCLDNVVCGDNARKLPCGHVFHRPCADSWLLTSRKNSCPLCMRKVCPERDQDMRIVNDVHAVGRPWQERVFG